MDKLDVRIVKLEPMRVASFHAYGAGPELEAAGKLVAWAKPLGLLDDGRQYRIFGFNNPDPSPGTPNYGYEFWITIGPELKAEKDIKVIEFQGGLFAVTRCRGVENITPTWQKLAAWRAASNYEIGSNYGLEEHLEPRPFSVTDKNLVMDIYFPIKE